MQGVWPHLGGSKGKLEIPASERTRFGQNPLTLLKRCWGLAWYSALFTQGLFTEQCHTASFPCVLDAGSLWQAQLVSTSVHLQSCLLEQKQLYASHQGVN